MTRSGGDDVTTPPDLYALPRSIGDTRMPDALAHMLATDAPEPFDSPDYIFELMWGGLRAMAYVRQDQVRLRARNGLDLTACFPELMSIPEHLRADEAILDGEIVAVDANGHPAFDLLRPRLHALAADTQPRPHIASPPMEFTIKRLAGNLSFQAFDLLWLDGRPLSDRALWQRKNRLHDIVGASVEFAAVDFVDDEGIAFFDAVLQRRLDGTVAKLKSSTYTPGRRSKSWLEIRALQSDDFVVGGYTFGGSKRKGEPFSQLLLGGYTDGRLEYVGSVSGGLSDTEAKALIAQLEPLHAAETPFDDPPPLSRLTFWTRPEMVCRVRFSEWSRDGLLRFPIFSALRPDLAPAECVLD